MASFVPFNDFAAKVAAGSINLTTAQLMLTLTTDANAPNPTDSVIGDLTPISLANVVGNMELTTTSAAATDTNGFQVTVADKQVTAGGGDVGPFQHAVVYVQGSGDLISMYDFGEELTIPDGTSMNFDFNQSTGLLRILFSPTP